MALSNPKLLNLFTVLVMFFTLFQGLIPSLPINDTAIISAVVMFLVQGLTAWRQAFSQNISNASLWPTIIIATVSTFGGLNDLFNVVQISEVAGQWIRFSITALTAILNLLSTILWPVKSVG